MDQDDPLRAYIERMLALREDADVTPEALRAVARELGLSDADLAVAERRAAEHRARGRGFLDHGLLDDAVRELTEAAALSPADPQTALDLARAHAARWRDAGDEADRRAADRLARRCLALDPANEGAFGVLRALKSRRGRWPWLAVAALVVIGGVVALLRAPAPRPASTAGAPATPATAAAPATPATAAAPAHGPLPVTLEGDRELVWMPGESRLDVYGAEAFYTVEGLLRNDGQRVLHHFQVKVEPLDAAGHALGTETVDLPGLLETDLRPRDTSSLFVTRTADARTAAVRLHVENVEAVERTAWPPSRPLKFAWSVPQPKGVDLVVRERQTENVPDTLQGGYYHEVVLEVTNPNQAPIRRLELRLRRLDAAGRTVHDGAGVTVANRQLSAPLHPGETRLVRDTEHVDVPVDRYELTVGAIEAPPPLPAAAPPQ
jgi:hypothetical protein